MVKQYELSIWEDYIPESGTAFEEQKLIVIGGDQYDSPQHAFNIKEQRSMNGDRTLSFSMLGKYRNSAGELVDNPYWNLLVNERKLKLRDGPAYDFSADLHELTEEDTDNRWRDYVIKTIVEDSGTYIYNYTAKEQYVNELGKNGWSVNLNTELNNNLGTLEELATKILEGSGWNVEVDGTVLEKVQMPLFKATLSARITATQISTGNTLSIPTDTIIYPLYSCVKRTTNDTSWELDKSNPIQFLYAAREFTDADTDDDKVIIDEESLFNYEIAPNLISTSTPAMTGGISAGPALRGNFIIKKQDVYFDNKLNRYVLKYTVNNAEVAEAGAPALNSEVLGYKETIFTTPTLVRNYLTNSNNFTSSTGWFSDRFPIPEPFTYPMPLTGTPDNWAQTTLYNYLKFDFANADTMYLNDGPKNNKMELIKGNRYVVRIRARMIKKDGTSIGTKIPSIHAALGVYDSSQTPNFRRLSNYVFVTGPTLGADGYPVAAASRPTFNSTLPNPVVNIDEYASVDEEGYVLIYLKATETTTVETSDVHFRLYSNDGGSPDYNYSIENIQLFDLVLDSANKPIFPDDTPVAEMIDRYRFYYYDVNGKSVDLIRNPDYYTPIYKDNYDAIRQINVQKSNYFNNTSTLAELFEVWVSYRVKHQQNGSIYKDINGKPIKTVYFSQFTPTNLPDNYAGFKYGINLNNITRNRDSSTIASRIIVEDNKQQFAKNGSASIKRALNNPSKDNEIFNFDYYINHNLLSLTQVLADLYGTNSSDFSYYPKIRKINEEYYAIAEKKLDALFEISVAESQVEFATEAIQSAADEISYQTIRYNEIPVTDTTYRNPIKVGILNLIAQKKGFETMLIKAQTKITHYENSIIELENRITTLLNSKKLLRSQFYEKYNRFIQEGVWVDENYIDDDLYYLDAYKIASVSAFPKTSYNINISDISNIEGYEPYRFEIGTKTYIEDTEFFGWTLKTIGGQVIKSPFRMEAIVSEQTYFYDDPTKSTLIIQTYKNQYQDLFQKVVASTNQLQYQVGAFSLAANQFSETGEIKAESLQNAFNNNALILSGSNNENVIWDKRGIEVSDILNSNNKVRISSGGIFITSDGGKTWTSGITGSGINTKKLLAGVIDTNQINILSNGNYAFRWDKSGISAFRSADLSFSPDQVVRFSQYGIYGTEISNTIDNYLTTTTGQALTFDQKIDYIKDNSNWSLTWDGLSLKAQDGSVSLTPIEGLQVFDATSVFGAEIESPQADNSIRPDGNSYLENDKVPLLSIGKFYISDAGVETEQYGLLMRNQFGEVTLHSNNDGNLWLSNKLVVGDALTDNGTSLEASRIIIDGLNKSIGSDPYIPSYRGWQIDSKGNAEFYNLVARGEFKATTFVYDEVNAQGGSLIIAESSVTYGETSVPEEGTFTLSTKNSYKGQPLLFNVNDKLRINTRLGHKLQVSATLGSNILTVTDTTYLFVGMFLHCDSASGLNGSSITSIGSKTSFTVSSNSAVTSNLVVDFEGKISLWLNVTAGGTSYLDYATYPVSILSNLSGSFILPEALPVINYHNSDTSGYIILKADNSTSGPFIDILENGNIDDIADELERKLKVRLGDLNGISDSNFGILSGYGLYSENTYLTGTMALPNAGMTNFSDASQPYANYVRIWAGKSYADRETAPFTVKQNGEMVLRDSSGAETMVFNPDPLPGVPAVQIGYGSITDAPYIPYNYTVRLTSSSNYISDKDTPIVITANIFRDGEDVSEGIPEGSLVWKIGDTLVNAKIGSYGKQLEVNNEDINQIGNITCTYKWTT